VKTAYVYIMANPSRTTYIGVTSDLEGRVWDHKTHAYPTSFTAKYDITRLVYVEEHANLDDAIGREKALKGKSRAKKTRLIETENPRWNDLAWDWFDEADIQADRARHVAEHRIS
jgi:putative endonuclease